MRKKSSIHRNAAANRLRASLLEVGGKRSSSESLVELAVAYKANAKMTRALGREFAAVDKEGFSAGVDIQHGRFRCMPSRMAEFPPISSVSIPPRTSNSA